MAKNQNTLIMMPGDVMKSLSIKPALIDELVYCSEETGISLSKIFNDALDWYCEVKAPILTQSTEAPAPEGLMKSTGRLKIGAALSSDLRSRMEGSQNSEPNDHCGFAE